MRGALPADRLIQHRSDSTREAVRAGLEGTAACGAILDALERALDEVTNPGVAVPSSTADKDTERLAATRTPVVRAIRARVSPALPAINSRPTSSPLELGAGGRRQSQRLHEVIGVSLLRRHGANCAGSTAEETGAGRYGQGAITSGAGIATRWGL
jgi:hypothetical protein